MRPRIVLVGEAAADRTRLKSVLRSEAFEVVGEAADRPAAIDIARRLQPDFAVLALEMPDADAVALLASIAEVCPAIHLIGVGPGRSRGAIESAFRAGLLGYVVRSKAAQELVRALREVGRGNVFVSPRAAGVLVERYRRENDVRPL